MAAIIGAKWRGNRRYPFLFYLMAHSHYSLCQLLVQCNENRFHANSARRNHVRNGVQRNTRP